MEGSVVDRRQRAGRSQQLNHDPPPEASYPVNDWLRISGLLIGKIPEVSGQATVPGGACGAG